MPKRDIAARTRAIVRTFNIPERILYALSKDPIIHFRGEDESPADHPSNNGEPLKHLQHEFSDLADLIRGKSVLDYGCGDGYQSAALAQLGASQVFGVDINAARIAFAKSYHHVPNVRYGTEINGQFDVVISQNAFEHFPRPEEDLQEIFNALRPGGKLLLTFGPPWLAPYGSHMHFITKCPWVNILFSEKTVYSVRRLYREDGASSYNGINKMTIKRFERIVTNSEFKMSRLRYVSVKKLPLVKRIPLLREMLIVVVTCVLEKPS